MPGRRGRGREVWRGEGRGGEMWDEEAIYTRPSCREYDEAVSARS
jgi:hypothetical protein